MFAQPYLFFEGRCEEAVNFYCSALGAEVSMMMRVKESPDPTMAMPGQENNILHCAFKVGDSVILASDGRAVAPPKFQGFALTITVHSEDEARRLFTPLSEGGEVLMPLMRTFYSPLFGMLSDKFGVMWMIMVGQ